MKFVMVFIDTLRPDHLGCYGYDRDTSPCIDDIASDSTVFTRCYATDVPTQPGFASIFTGQRGIRSGIVTHSPHETLSPDAPWLPSIMQAGSYTTGAVSTLYHMKPLYAAGFSHYINPVAGTPRLTQRVTADQINAHALPWIEAHAGEDFLLFIHYWDVHEYTDPPGYRNLFYDGDLDDQENDSLREARENPVWPFLKRKLDHIGEGITDAGFVVAQYDSALRYVDERVGEVVSRMEELGILDETLLVISSDHGESFGEHSIYFDHASVYEDTARVPLLVRQPENGGIRTNALVQSIDIAPTVLELAGFDRCPDMQGQSLVHLLDGDGKEHREVAYVNQGAWQAKRAMITQQFKYTRTIHHGFWPCPPEELFDLSEDPDELNDLSGDKPEVLDRMAAELRRWEVSQLGCRVDPLVRATEIGLRPLRWVWELVRDGEGTFDEWSRKIGW